ncbi:expressed unknown protein [Seminavis robusta]|uniref:Uncharacterized protein n=1 Tax=Seminavis robusta TaxID=568900 RepID=A0A9N8HHM4_9STRA|nr:expressed unknown protein [Seminavis robusta]|eukprot:Sro544_g163700.1 n/a (93) ;mRNA; f:51294-51572
MKSTNTSPPSLQSLLSHQFRTNTANLNDASSQDRIGTLRNTFLALEQARPTRQTHPGPHPARDASSRKQELLDILDDVLRILDDDDLEDDFA